MLLTWTDITRQIWLLVIGPSIYCFPVDPTVSNENTSSKISINFLKSLNEQCFFDEECQSFDIYSECDVVCRCKKNYGIVVTESGSACRLLHAEPPPPSALGDRCKTSQECINHVDKRSECFKKNLSNSAFGKCVCSNEADSQDGKCVLSADPDSVYKEGYYQTQPSDYKFAIIIVISTVIIFVLIFIGIGFLKFFLPCVHPALQNQCVQVHLESDRSRTMNVETNTEDRPPSYIELMKREVNILSPPPKYSEVVAPVHSQEQKPLSNTSQTCHHCCHSVEKPPEDQAGKEMAKE